MIKSIEIVTGISEENWKALNLSDMNSNGPSPAKLIHYKIIAYTATEGLMFIFKFGKINYNCQYDNLSIKGIICIPDWPKENINEGENK